MQGFPMRLFTNFYIMIKKLFFFVSVMLNIRLWLYLENFSERICEKPVEFFFFFKCVGTGSYRSRLRFLMSDLFYTKFSSFLQSIFHVEQAGLGLPRLQLHAKEKEPRVRTRGGTPRGPSLLCVCCLLQALLHAVHASSAYAHTQVVQRGFGSRLLEKICCELKSI